MTDQSEIRLGQNHLKFTKKSLRPGTYTENESLAPLVRSLIISSARIRLTSFINDSISCIRAQHTASTTIRTTIRVHSMFEINFHC